MIENRNKRTSLGRRAFLRAAVAAGSALGCASRRHRTAVRLEELRHEYESFTHRSTMRFGRISVDRSTMIHTTCVVSTGDGRRVQGFASMKMPNAWSFRSRVLSFDQTLEVMKRVAGRAEKILLDYREPGHPVEIYHAVEPALLAAAGEVARELQLPEPVPKLCTLCSVSSFDAALHDAFGKAHGRNCYQTYGPDFLAHDLSKYLGPEYRGEYIDRYLSPAPTERIAVFHAVGALDPITRADVKEPVGDGLPETLPEWIRHNGLTHFKIKMEGNDLRWDVDRILKIERVVAGSHRELGLADRQYSLDFNEACPNVDYLLDFLQQVREKSPAAFDRIQFIEQPTQRDLRADRANVMHEAAKLKPVVIDESLTDLETLLLAREMGYTGVALKVAKGHSKSLILGAAGQKLKMFICVQDAGLPGAALVHSAGLAAHLPTVTGLEANARQYLPQANTPWEKKLPEIFVIKDGSMRTGVLTGPGLSAVV